MISGQYRAAVYNVFGYAVVGISDRTVKPSLSTAGATGNALSYPCLGKQPPTIRTARVGEVVGNRQAGARAVVGCALRIQGIHPFSARSLLASLSLALSLCLCLSLQSFPCLSWPMRAHHPRHHHHHNHHHAQRGRVTPCESVLGGGVGSAKQGRSFGRACVPGPCLLAHAC